MEIYDRGENIRNWIYVEDHCKILAKILFNKKLTGEYNISTKYYFSNKILVKKIYNYLINKKINTKFNSFKNFINFVKDRPAHDKKYNIDSKKLHQIFNFSKSISNFDNCLIKTVDWYLSNENFYKKKKKFLNRQGTIKD